MRPARRCAPPGAPAEYPVLCAPGGCPLNCDDHALGSTIVPGETDTHRHLPRPPTPLLADSGLNDRNLEAALGYPIRRRDDAATYAVPLKRKKIKPVAPTPPGATPKAFTPEPALAQADYEEAIDTLLNSRNAIERSPSTAAKLKEQELRDILLSNLNGRFEGAASGEVFNGNGKTDILIRQGDRNIFIGECKFWDGPSKFDDAINQLLGYTVWRDTKAAIILFIRSGSPTALTGKAVERIKQHPNYKRRGPNETEDRHDFVLHPAGDPDREIHLALLPFVIKHADAGEETER